MGMSYSKDENTKTNRFNPHLAEVRHDAVFMVIVTASSIFFVPVLVWLGSNFLTDWQTNPVPMLAFAFFFTLLPLVFAYWRSSSAIKGDRITKPAWWVSSWEDNTSYPYHRVLLQIALFCFLNIVLVAVYFALIVGLLVVTMLLLPENLPVRELVLYLETGALFIVLLYSLLSLRQLFTNYVQGLIQRTRSGQQGPLLNEKPASME
jgi:membrane protease YdiL (CAAX protease family)